MISHRTLQTVRAIDVLALGPVMIAAAMRKPFKSEIANNFLFVSGIATIAFNGKRLLENAP